MSFVYYIEFHHPMMAIYIMSVLYIDYISSLPNIDVSKPYIMHYARNIFIKY